jgi:hypothetical protein
VSAATLLAVHRLMGLRSTVVYVAVLALCAIGFGLLVDALVPAGWSPPGIRTVAAHAHCETGMAWRVHGQAAVLLAVVAWAKWGLRKQAAGPAAERQ